MEEMRRYYRADRNGLGGALWERYLEVDFLPVEYKGQFTDITQIYFPRNSYAVHDVLFDNGTINEVFRDPNLTVWSTPTLNSVRGTPKYESMFDCTFMGDSAFFARLALLATLLPCKSTEVFEYYKKSFGWEIDIFCPFCGRGYVPILGWSITSIRKRNNMRCQEHDP
ncbi:MAG: hypothetical protein COU90_01240 [Candidatus Ryanbacteria bacterium CG10_big_fil_rev_8_21_14_0_10_43_42]|uniref:Uncharacterized protein n=1 Tax=Candidatus Ryanbacteria bacterium CG10_big_fil_rev_8_21_14_0_10_43_42 TaxID=1974864 RepID=A0A2M8KY90_9BACT|nr:MAG: hypothetical protein COU90_01240 [Candidatus Ryanbacteria bacterium CG10_big_fil_rev_8_21_14_0_10_43_42]